MNPNNLIAGLLLLTGAFLLSGGAVSDAPTPSATNARRLQEAERKGKGIPPLHAKQMDVPARTEEHSAPVKIVEAPTIPAASVYRDPADDDDGADSWPSFQI